MGNNCGGLDAGAACLGVDRAHRNVCMLGLDGAGKTTMCLTLVGKLEEKAIPTGMNPVVYPNKQAKTRMNEWLFALPSVETTMRVLDLGGHHKCRNQWTQNLREVLGLVFVVDACDPKRLPEAKEVLHNHVISHALAAQIPILILGNIKDGSEEMAMTEDEVLVGLGLTGEEDVSQGESEASSTSYVDLIPDDRIHFQMCSGDAWVDDLERGFGVLVKMISDSVQTLQGRK